jgi:hypothetical protein
VVPHGFVIDRDPVRERRPGAVRPLRATLAVLVLTAVPSFWKCRARFREAPMAEVNCPKCGKKFDPTNHAATAGAAAAGAAAGAAIGSTVGIAGGPLGAIAGTIPGAIVGGALAGLGITKFAKCPGCGDIFML